ncbi:MAG: ABC transporter ATP-binding protein [Treponemataceae bacterium]|nr:ABC transporter ATP-binding protein [Treponemataceae bacterium]
MSEISKTNATEKTEGAMLPLLEVKNLCVEFSEKKIRAIEDVCIKIFPGEFVALVGESGCGKTLTASAIMNVLPQNAKISKGEILFSQNEQNSKSENSFAKNILELDEKSRREISGKNISMIFQDPSAALDPLCTCGKQIEESSIVHGMPKKAAREQAKKIMAKTGLCDIKRIYKSFPHELSGGQKQRVLIAAALINSPRLLIADEPTSALDATLQKEILQTILNLNKELKTSLLLITHDFSIVKKICARVYVMYAGRIIESGATEEVLQNPLHPYTEALLRAIPNSAKKGEKLFTVPGSVPSPAERKKNQCNFFSRCPNAKAECARQNPKPKFFGEHFVECNFAHDKNH